MSRKWLKRIAVFLGSLLLLVIILILFLHTTMGRSIVRKKVESYLRNQFNTTVSIGDIDYRLPNWIQLKDVLILDLQKDTLLKGGNLYVKIDMLKLLSQNVKIGGIKLENIAIHIRRAARDSVFNYQFILDAFASPSTAPKKNTNPDPIQLSIDRISLNNVVFSLSDNKQRQYINASIGKLLSTPKNLEPGKSAYSFKEFVTTNCSITIVDSSYKTETVSKSYRDENSKSDNNPLLLAIQQLGLKDVQFSYNKPADKLSMKLHVDSISLDNASVNLYDQIIHGTRFTMENSSFVARVWMPGKKSDNVKEYVTESVAPKNWNISIDKIILSNNAFTYDNMAMPPAQGIDYNHLDAKNIYLATRNNKLDGDDFLADIDSCSFILNKDMVVKNIHSAVIYKEKTLLLTDAAIAFNETSLYTSGDLVIPFTNEVITANHSWRFQNTVISYADIALLQPNLLKTLPVHFSNSEMIMISAQCNGTLQNFIAKDLILSTRSKQLFFSGDIGYKNTAGRDGMTYTATIRQMQVQKNILSPSLQTQLKKSQINLPPSISLNGSLTGTANKLVTNMRVISSYGQANIKGTISNFNQPHHMEYDLMVEGKNLETGKWISQEKSLGPMTGYVKLKGKGTSMNNTTASGEINMRSVMINGYSYSNVQLHTGITGNEFYLNGSIADTALATSLNIQGEFVQSYPIVNGFIAVEKANLRAIQFTKDSITISGKVRLDSLNTNPEFFLGTMYADSARLIVNGQHFAADSILLRGHSATNGSEITVRSPFFEGTLLSGTSLPMAQNEMIDYIRQFTVKNNEPLATRTNNSWLSIDASLKHHELLSAFIPGLERFSPITITGSYDGNKPDSQLHLQIQSQSIKYRSFQADQLDITAGSSGPLLQYNVSAKRLLAGTDTLLKPSVSGSLSKDSLIIVANVDDDKGNVFYSAKASIQQIDSATVFHLLDDITINSNRWVVPETNRVTLRRDGYIINNFSLQRSGQSIVVNSHDPLQISPIDIRIENVDIGSLLAFTTMNDTTFAEGKINVAVTVQQPIKKIPVLTGNLDVRNLAIRQTPVGDLHFDSHVDGDSLVMLGTLSGNNQAEFSGRIHAGDRNMDLHANLQKLEMKLVQEFTKKYVSRLSGNINGEIHMRGSPVYPMTTGFIHFDSVAFAMKDLGAIYRIHDQDIKLEYPDILLNDFKITDSLGRIIEIDGAAKMKNLAEYELNLEAKTKNFLALNAKRSRDSYFYGTGIVDIELKITGTSSDPVIAGNAFLHPKSNIHYILPQNKDYTSKSKDLVRFVDIDTIPLPSVLPLQVEKDSSRIRKKSLGLQYNLNLEVSKEAEFSIIIDPTTNDELVIKGDAQLHIGLEENGSMGITGVYQLQSGFYNMNTQFLKGKFLLARGSTITFNGDPYNAEANVTTEYEVKSSAAGLLGTDESETPGISKRLPFLVVFTIKGPLSKPELAFDIRLKSNAPGISNSLKSEVEVELDILRRDVSVLNQQVFSLLVMSQFTVNSGKDNSYLDFDADVAVKDGMSKFLSEAMNQVADDLIKGMDVDVNMKNYKEEGTSDTRTDIDVAVSKDMFKDRLTITVGKNFTVGESNTNTTYQNNAEQYIPDVTSTYKLSKDGRYLAKAYRKNEYDAVVEGYFAETGVSFSIEMDYNKFKEIFQRKKKLQNQ